MKKNQNILTGLCSLVPPHVVSFLESVPQPDLVDDNVWLFLLSCVCYGISTEKNNKHHSYKKGKNRGKAAFFKETSNYFILLNLRSLIERFGP
jgi:hypothetical protein